MEVLKIINEEASMTVVIFSSLLTWKQLPTKCLILLHLMKNHSITVNEEVHQIIELEEETKEC